MRFPAAALLAFLAITVQAQSNPPLVLPSEAKITFIGGTFVERDQAHGYLETRLITANPDKTIVFRNLGWSADNVRAESRAGFGQPIEAFNRLVAQVKDLKPNLIFLHYGLNESYAGPAGLEAFTKDFSKMLDAFSAENTQIVLLGPIALENLGPPLPDPAGANKNIRLYADAIAKLAADRKLRFVDLYDLPDQFAKTHSKEKFTENNVHLTPAGYQFAAAEIMKRLGFPDQPWTDRHEQIRKITIDKNRLYFHRWRPENETYIFGFRKAEQGRNAVEIPQFDPLVAAKEAEIEKLKK